jgi:hypothetical protein
MGDICQNTFNFDIRPAVGGQDFFVAFSNQKAVEWFDHATKKSCPPTAGRISKLNVF